MAKASGISTVTTPEVLRHRLVLFFSIGFVASLTAFFIDRYIFKQHGSTDWSRDSTNSVDLIVDHVKSIPKKPSVVSELPIPSEMDAVVMKCLEKKPEDRFQTPMELAEALRTIPDLKRWTARDAKNWWSLHVSQGEYLPVRKPLKQGMPGMYQPVKEATAARAS